MKSFFHNVVWLALSLGVLCTLALAQAPEPNTTPGGMPKVNLPGTGAGANPVENQGANSGVPTMGQQLQNEPPPEGAEPKFTPRTACEGRTIDRITVKGNERVTSEDVIATMGLEKGAVCSDSEVAKDVRALWDLEFFDDIGIDAVEVGKTKIRLTVIVHERPAISKILFSGNNEIESSDITEKLEIKEGEILSVPQVQAQIVKIRDLYAEKGYFLAHVTFKTKPKPDNEVDVEYTVEEGAKVSVRSIRFIGNRAVTEAEIRSAMQTKQTGFWSFLSSSDTYQRAQFEDDVTRLQVLYYDKGFLTVQVGNPRVELTPDRRHIDITVPVTEGPRYKVGKLAVIEVDPKGLEIEPLTGRAALREKITLDRGDWFSRATIAKDLIDIRRVYRDSGYANVAVDPQTALENSRHIVYITIQIQRGVKVYIERINFAGNTRTRDSVLRREMRISEGDLYNQTLVETSKARATALGYFERVDLAEEAGSKSNRIVLNFDVVERATGTFQVGAGFSSFESFIFTAQVQQQNLFGKGQTLGLQLQLSGIRQLAQIQFIEPYFYDTEWTMGVEAYKTIRIYQSFSRDSTGGSLSFGHPILLDDLRLFLQYRGEFVDIGTQSTGIFGGNAGYGYGANIFQQLPLANLYRSGLTSSVQLSLSWDSRDNRMFPSKGVFTTASTEVAAAWTGSQNKFLRHRIFFRFYRPLIAGLVFKLNSEWGLVTSSQPQGVPIFERFFLGGIYNVRGFNYFSLGPRIGIPSTTDPNGIPPAQGVVIGGNMQAFYNLEIEFPILESVGIRGVVFTDGGNAWNTESVLCQAPTPTYGDHSSDPCSVNPFDLRQSWGFGVRWVSPLGPLRFEWGFPFAPRPYEPGNRFEFTIGNFF